MAKRKDKNNILSFFGVMLIFFALCIGIYYHFENKKIVEFETGLIEDYIEDTNHNNINNETEIIEEEVVEEPKQKVKINYSMILEIPKIGLKKGIYDINSRYNNVSYNIQLLKESSMPDKDRGVTMFAGHNGNSSVSYFRNLNKLNKNDEVLIYYNGIKYTYKISNIYDIPKTGKATIRRNFNYNTVVLVTCKKNTKDTQTVYIGYLDSKSEY